MSNTNTINDREVSLLKALLADSEASCESLSKEIETNEAKPKGTRGKKAEALVLAAKYEAAYEIREELEERLDEALRPYAVEASKKAQTEAVKDTTYLKALTGARINGEYGVLLTIGNRKYVLSGGGADLNHTIELAPKETNEKIIEKANRYIKECESSLKYLKSKYEDKELDADELDETSRKINEVTSNLVEYKCWIADPENACVAKFGYSVDVRSHTYRDANGDYVSDLEVATSTFSGDAVDVADFKTMLDVALVIINERKSVVIPQDGFYKTAKRNLRNS
jgi:hypothetical protein